MATIHKPRVSRAAKKNPYHLNGGPWSGETLHLADHGPTLPMRVGLWLGRYELSGIRSMQLVSAA
jgi:hypothetical protein